MTTTSEIEAQLEALDTRLRTILPEEYADCYEAVQPVSMGSAGLKYGADGKVAWDDMWESFCDLAMAGGPPHKGRLLEPGSPAEVEANPDRYTEVVAEICRGIAMVTELPVEPAPTVGWVRVECETPGMAQWLVRAVVMENVSARAEETWLHLPAGPSYRIEKEIKNVITVIAKTCHYWLDHMWVSQHRTIGELFTKITEESPLIQPEFAGDGSPSGTDADLSARIAAATGLRPSARQYSNWFGVECPDVRSAVWMMRALVVGNVLARREETALYVAINGDSDPGGDIVVQSVIRVSRFAAARGVLPLPLGA